MAVPAVVPAMSENDVYDAIRAAHAPPEWACFRDVADSTGGRHRRRADALALNLWPSRGMEIRGFEIKVDRHDLVRELHRPEKAETIARYCNSWWIVAPDGVVEDAATLPLSWGLMEATSKGLRVRKQAVVRPDSEVTPLGRMFVAALARAVAAEVEDVRKRYVRREQIATEVNEAYQRGVSEAPRATQLRIESLERRLAGALPVLAALGIDVDADDWSVARFDKHVGEEAAAALALGRCLRQKYGHGAFRAAELIADAMRELQSARDALGLLILTEKAP